MGLMHGHQVSVLIACFLWKIPILLVQLELMGIWQLFLGTGPNEAVRCSQGYTPS